MVIRVSFCPTKARKRKRWLQQFNNQKLQGFMKDKARRQGCILINYEVLK
jgi:hypothetical protein